MAEGTSWKPRGQFAYSRDRALKDLELSGADLRFRNLVQVDGKSCAWVTSQYVFSPVDLPAAGTASGGRVVPAAGNNAVAAVLHISLLLDPASHHVAWLHRSQTIDNKLTLASPFDDGNDPRQMTLPTRMTPENPMPDLSSMRSDNPGRYPFMTFHFQEEARARLLPDERVVEWLAALKRFEATPEPESGTTPVPLTKTLLPNPIVQAAKPAVVKRTTHVVIDSDSLVATPAGFTRSKKICAAIHGFARPLRWPCRERCRSRRIRRCAPSIWRGRTIYAQRAVGPALDRRRPGLTEDEELSNRPNTTSRTMSGWRSNPESGPAFPAPRSTDIRD